MNGPKLSSASGALHSLPMNINEIEEIKNFLESLDCPVEIEEQYKNEEEWISDETKD